MSDGKQSVEKEMTAGEALGIVVGLAAGASLTLSAVESDPERLAPVRVREQAALNLVEEFLQIHLYGDCNPCA